MVHIITLTVIGLLNSFINHAAHNLVCCYGCNQPPVGVTGELSLSVDNDCLQLVSWSAT